MIEQPFISAESSGRIARLYSWLRFPYRDDVQMSVAFFIILVVPLILTQGLTDNSELPRLVILIVSLAIGLSLSIKRVTVVRHHKIVFTLLALFVLQAVIATIFSIDYVTSLIGLYTRWTSSLLFYTAWAFSIVFFFQALSSEDRLNFLLRTAVFTAFAVSIFGIAQYFGFAYYAGLNPSARSLIPSFLGNPNFSAMYVASLMPIMVWAYQRSKTAVGRIYYLLVIGSSIVAIAMFNSRGAIIAAVLGLGFLAVVNLLNQTSRRQATLSIITAFLIIGVSFLLLLASRPETLQSTASLSGTDVTPRFLVWKQSLRFMADNPWVGVGPGNYYLAHEKNVDPALLNGETFDDAHNIALHLGVNGGIPLLVLYLAIVLVALWCGWQSWRNTQKPIYLVLIAAVIAWQAAAAFNPVVISCWVLLAFLLAGLTREQANQASFNIPIIGRWSARIAAIIVGLFGIGLLVNDYFSVAIGPYYYAKKYDVVIRYAKILYPLNISNNGGIRYWAGSLIEKNEDPQQTARVIEKYYNVHPSSSRVVSYTSALYFRLYLKTNNEQYLRNSYKYGDKSVEQGPFFPFLYYQNAYIHYRAKDYDAAEKYLRQSLAIKPKSLSGWSLLSKVQLERGNRDGVIEALGKTLELEPKSPAYKALLEAAKNQPDVTKIEIPISFTDPEI